MAEDSFMDSLVHWPSSQTLPAVQSGVNVPEPPILEDPSDSQGGQGNQMSRLDKSSIEDGFSPQQLGRGRILLTRIEAPRLFQTPSQSRSPSEEGSTTSIATIPLPSRERRVWENMAGGKPDPDPADTTSASRGPTLEQYARSMAMPAARDMRMGEQEGLLNFSESFRNGGPTAQVTKDTAPAPDHMIDPTSQTRKGKPVGPRKVKAYKVSKSQKQTVTGPNHKRKQITGRGRRLQMDGQVSHVVAGPSPNRSIETDCKNISTTLRDMPLSPGAEGHEICNKDEDGRDGEIPSQDAPPLPYMLATSVQTPYTSHTKRGDFPLILEKWHRDLNASSWDTLDRNSRIQQPEKVAEPAYAHDQSTVARNSLPVDRVLVIGPKFFAYLEEWKESRRLMLVQDSCKKGAREDALFKAGVEARQEQLHLKCRMLDFTAISAEEMQAFLQCWETFDMLP